MDSKKFIKRLLLICFVIWIYLILSITIYQNQTEKKMADLIIQSVTELNPNKPVDEYTRVMNEEGTLVTNVSDDLSTRLSGMILLQVESKGEAWYVNPSDKKKYYLGRPADALRIIKNFGVGINNKELDGYLKYRFPRKLSGSIVLDVEAFGEAYYVYPRDLNGYYLGHPEDAFSVMREKGIGISNSDLRQIAVGGL